MVQAGFRADARIGPYFLVELRGGGMGQVWRAVHQGTGRPVAIKIAHREDAWVLPAFQAEIRVAARMAHPNIVAVRDVLLVDADAERATGGLLRAGHPALVMDWVDGPALSEYLGKLAWDSTRRILAGLLDALAYAHQHGVLHRDVKPSNVLLEGGAPRLVDFGIARPPIPGVRSGTPAYMAPEQFDPAFGPEGPWTDLYNLGCLAHAVVTRQPPYGTGTWDQMSLAHRTAPVPDVLRGMDPLGGWITWMLAKRPSDRPQSAHEARLALGELPFPQVARTSTLEADPG